MFEYSLENELKNYIIEHFSDFFNFKYITTERKLKYGRVDIIGEDENNIYIIEVKRDKIIPTSIKQIKRYMIEYETNKNVVGILIAPNISDKAISIIEKENSIEYKQISNVNINGSCCITKSLHFTKENFNILDFALKQSKILNQNFSEYVLGLIREKQNEGIKLSENMEKQIIELIKKYSPTANSNDIKDEDTNIIG